MQITCNTSGAHHMKCVVCHMVCRDSSTIRSDRVQTAFTLVVFYGLKQFTDEGREETGVPGENP